MNASGGTEQSKDLSAFAVFSRPNFFELYLRDSVPELLEDAFCSVWHRFGLRELLGNVSGHTAFSALRVLVDSACLWKASTTISDALVGLKRVSCTGDGHLSPQQKLGIVIFGAMIPVILRALKRCAKKQFEGVYANELKNRTEEDSKLKTIWLRVCEKIGRISRNILPWIRGSQIACSLLFSLGFLANMTRYTSLTDLLLGTSVSHAPARSLQSTKGKGTNGVLQSIASIGADGLRLLLPLLVFGYRSVEWWFAVPHAIATRKNRTQLQWEGIPPPPPPSAPRLAPGVILAADSTLCPLCGKPIRLPAVLSSSGYAFCFPCIVKYVKQYHECPLTGLPADETQIHRLYLK